MQRNPWFRTWMLVRSYLSELSSCLWLRDEGLWVYFQKQKTITTKPSIQIHTFQFSHHTGQFIILSQLESDMVESIDSIRSKLLSFHWGILSNWKLLTLYVGNGKTLQDVSALKKATGVVLHNCLWIVLQTTPQETLKSVYYLLNTKKKNVNTPSIIWGNDIIWSCREKIIIFSTNQCLI